jgi:hypothetical protein
MGMQYRTHELVRWWLQEIKEVRTHVVRMVLRLPTSQALVRVEWHDTHISFDVPGLEADCVFDVWINAAESCMAVTEIQLSRDEQKTVTWMAYLSATQIRHRKPAVLGILTFDEAMAGWCRQRVIRPGGRHRMVQVRVLGPATWNRYLVPDAPPGDALRRYVLCWLAGQRIAEFEQALAKMLDHALGLDSALWRWYVATLCRVAELHAPHLTETIMNQVKYKHPFQPIFDHEWEAVERGRVEGRDEGRAEGSVKAFTRVLEDMIGTRRVAQMLASTPGDDHERVLYEAIQAQVRRLK